MFAKNYYAPTVWNTILYNLIYNKMNTTNISQDGVKHFSYISYMIT